MTRTVIKVDSQWIFLFVLQIDSNIHWTAVFRVHIAWCTWSGASEIVEIRKSFRHRQPVIRLIPIITSADIRAGALGVRAGTVRVALQPITCLMKSLSPQIARVAAIQPFKFAHEPSSTIETPTCASSAWRRDGVRWCHALLEADTATITITVHNSEREGKFFPFRDDEESFFRKDSFHNNFLFNFEGSFKWNTTFFVLSFWGIIYVSFFLYFSTLSVGLERFRKARYNKFSNKRRKN